MGTAKQAAPFVLRIWARLQTFVTLKRCFLAAVPLGMLFFSTPARAQTAEKLDALLNTERVSFAQAAGLILPAAGLLAPEAGETEAFAAVGH
jgi:hypothetical protein